MSHEHTDGTKLGPSFDAVSISTADDQDYPNDWEMEDTASNSVRVVGEVVAETDVSSLGLSPQVALTADSLRNVTSPSTAVVRNLGDVGSDVTKSLISGVNVAETTASGSQVPSDARHPKEFSPHQGENERNHLMAGLDVSSVQSPVPPNCEHVWHGYNIRK